MSDTERMPRTRCYREGVLTDENFALEDVSEHLAEESSLVWVDLCAPDQKDLQLVADELGLHTAGGRGRSDWSPAPEVRPLRRT